MTVRIHLQVSMSSPDLLDELRRYTDPRGRAARLKALADLGLRVERGLVPLPEKPVRAVTADVVPAPVLPVAPDAVATPARAPRARKPGTPSHKSPAPVVQRTVASVEPGSDADSDDDQLAKDALMSQLLGV